MESNQKVKQNGKGKKTWKNCWQTQATPQKLFNKVRVLDKCIKNAQKMISKACFVVLTHDKYRKKKENIVV